MFVGVCFFSLSLSLPLLTGGSCHIFYSNRAVDVPDGLPKWMGHKDTSEVMPETMCEEQAPVDGKM